MNEQATTTSSGTSGLSRRRFFGYAGALAGAGLLMSTGGCKKDDDYTNGPSGSVDVGYGDIGVLNYAFALEQLEAAFYSQVALTFYSGITATEQSYLSDVRDHEVAHREFFRAALGHYAIRNLTPDFSSVDFSSRTSVLATAKAFEDLGVSAYNGAGKLLTDPGYLTLAGKIVSVEARHAAIIRELIVLNTFAGTDVLDDATRRDFAREPSAVIAMAQPFIREKLYVGNLPTS